MAREQVFVGLNYFSNVSPSAAFDVKADFLYVAKLFPNCCVFYSFLLDLGHSDAEYPSDG